MHPPGPVATGSIPQHPHPCGGVLGPDVLEEGCGGPREPHPQWAGVERWCEVMVLPGCLAASSLVSQDPCTQVPGGVPWGPSGTATSVTLCLCPSLRTLRSPAHQRERPALTRAEPYSRRPALSAHGAPDSRSPARRGPAQARGEFRYSSSKQVGARMGGASSRTARAGKGRPRRLPAAFRGSCPDPAPAAGAQVWEGARGGRRRGRGSPFWPLSAAYQESERKAHRQKSSSVRKAPLRSLISSGARWAPAGPRPHGPGGPGPGRGDLEAAGAPAPGQGGAGSPGPGRDAGGPAGLGTGPGTALTAPLGRGEWTA